MIVCRVYLRKQVVGPYYIYAKMTDSQQRSQLLSFPAEIIEMIFGYLSDEDIYFNVRSVCQSLKELAERFIRLGKINNPLIYIHLI